MGIAQIIARLSEVVAYKEIHGVAEYALIILVAGIEEARMELTQYGVTLSRMNGEIPVEISLVAVAVLLPVFGIEMLFADVKIAVLL